MANSTPKTLRCAIYTRKSTEHGLELEFNSLDAQREACEAYIKSQASQGWKALPQLYDDPAFSGGNLERPALKRLLADIEADRVDVVVVYKIDRLTRSLADFAKLVEAFDARSISFVAVTQQFNTTTSMGRLTLNVLLSFAQFERELSSERVRDKIAASRAKGKWTGGNIPFGYRTENKKLIIDDQEAEIVQYIFKRYLELGSFGPLVLDLDAKGFRSRIKKVKGSDTRISSRFTYGPLAYLLNSRIYIGEVPHKDKWYPAEHPPIVTPTTFEAVQSKLASNSVTRKNRRSQSGALLTGKLFDDRDNRMSPSYSTKKGVRYRFYVSAALLRGRKAEAGSLTRVPAPELELAVLQAIRARCDRSDLTVIPDTELIETYVERVTVANSAITIVFPPHIGFDNLAVPRIDTTSGTMLVKHRHDDNTEADPVLVHVIAKAHARIKDLAGGRFDTVEALAARAKAHPKMLRQELRLAFLAPDILTAILQGDQPAGLTLTAMLPTLPLSWAAQRRAIGL